MHCDHNNTTLYKYPKYQNYYFFTLLALLTFACKGDFKMFKRILATTPTISTLYKTWLRKNGQSAGGLVPNLLLPRSTDHLYDRYQARQAQQRQQQDQQAQQERKRLRTLEIQWRQEKQQRRQQQQQQQQQLRRNPMR